MDAVAIHCLYTTDGILPQIHPILGLKYALWTNLNVIVSLDVSHVETFCFPNRNKQFPLMKQFVSIKETNKKHIVFQIVRLNNCLKLFVFYGNDV